MRLKLVVNNREANKILPIDVVGDNASWIIRDWDKKINIDMTGMSKNVGRALELGRVNRGITLTVMT